ncbi:hybrid sensor histidine kinase/response regulator [Bordetella flabilis]|uniref:Chemotaxis protein CheA n=1 Tax=Bordetella flabilis TaxID=463014 RepID=A0A193GCA1_9BORD|nr:hybrid sensor histidine kinase/response regulator [Bordetella flabilis]ANN77086.1 hybrid sensor histidine kinase/response regulator [Bordetella flabilis]
MTPDNMRDASLVDLYKMEVRGQVQVLDSGLLALERDPTEAAHLAACMRAAHSLKGAARIVGLEAPVRVAHAMEDRLVEAQAGRTLDAGAVDMLLRGTDLLRNMPGEDPQADAAAAEAFVASLAVPAHGSPAPRPDTPAAPVPPATSRAAASPGPAAAREGPHPEAAASPFTGVPEQPPAPRHAISAETPEPARLARATDAPGNVSDAASARAQGAGEARALRVTARTLDELLGLSSETLVEAHRLTPFANSLLPLKRMHDHLAALLESLQHRAAGTALEDGIAQARQQAGACQRILADRMAQADQFGWRIGDLGQRLYDTALACRMRPFGDAVSSLPRMVRDLARTLGKQAHLDIQGTATRVDRDILERLDAPLTHLLRNALDHGIETPAERRAAGKPEQGTITLEARHSAGMLRVEVSDDGRGIDQVRLRNEIVQRGLAAQQTVETLSETEVLAFLFLPGFTTRAAVTEISGRGVGLDVVHDMARQLRGAVRVHQRSGAGTRFTLELPLSLSVVRSLIVDIGGERYAFPLAYVSRALRLPRTAIEQLEGRQHFPHDGRQVGLVGASQVLQYANPAALADPVPVVLLDDHQGRNYGVAVDRFVAEQTLVVQPLDPRLGKLQDVQAGAIMEDGTPVLILDVEDMIRTIEKLVASGGLQRVGADAAPMAPARRKRVLVVDDSLTVRELERKLLVNRGYDVAVAVDGMDGWNMVRAQDFDLIVTDVDMPRMDGIELVTLIRKDPRLQSMHVMVVSYKDRPEDRQRGLDAGADYYLGKSSFHDDALLEAVADLIGQAGT